MPWITWAEDQANPLQVNVRFDSPGPCSSARAAARETADSVDIGIYLRALHGIVQGVDCDRLRGAIAGAATPASASVRLQHPIAQRRVVDTACARKQWRHDSFCLEKPK